MIIDRNRWQSCDAVDCTLDIEPLSVKLAAFKWNTIEIDGHDIKEIINALDVFSSGKPLAVIARTVKGKGVSFMEEDNSWHQKIITDEEYKIAISELSRGDSFD
jgi:transketolase